MSRWRPVRTLAGRLAAAGRADRGAALVEVFFLGTLLLVPLVYLVVVLARVQGVAFAAGGAVRDAARAYATASDPETAVARAELAAQQALADAGVPAGTVHVSLRCAPGPCDLTPGSTVSVALDVPVGLPGLAALLCGPHGCPASIPVHVRHTERLDCFVSGRTGPC